ncbi:hypothetical protein [Providencia rettgeri]|uniref:hypothetical protein n=1 Tax=Providencia rettgeri TaxID=587 RepID=UPI000318AFCD|nr:hypothetical protein [Providencia rettgeri]
MSIYKVGAIYTDKLKRIATQLLISSLLLLLFSCFGKAYSLYLSSDISSLEPNKSFFSKSYINDTKKVNLYTFSAYQIDKPDNKEQGKPIEEGEIIFTPLKKSYYPVSKSILRFFIAVKRMIKNAIIRL